MYRVARILVGALFLASLPGCVGSAPRPARLVGAVGGKPNIVGGYSVTSTGALAISGATRLPNATVAVVVGEAGGDHVLALLATAPDGSFTLEYPPDPPVGAAILVTAEGHEPYRAIITPSPPGYKEISFVLRKIDPPVVPPQ